LDGVVHSNGAFKTSIDSAPLEPALYRAIVDFASPVDDTKNITYPRVYVSKVDYQTGKVSTQHYDFPEFAVQIPGGFVKESKGDNHWVSGKERFKFGEFQFFRLGSIEVTYRQSEQGWIAYHPMAEMYYTYESSSPYDPVPTRPFVTTLFAFNVDTHKLSIVNQLEDDEKYFHYVLPEINAYSIKNSDFIYDYYSLDDHRYLFTAWNRPRVFNYGVLQSESSYDPIPNTGDVLFGTKGNFNELLIVRPDGTYEQTTRVHGDRLDNYHYSRIKLEDDLFELTRNVIGEFSNNYVLSRTRGDKTEVLNDGKYALGHFSPMYKTLLMLTPVSESYHINVYDIEKQQIIRSSTEGLLKISARPALRWSVRI